MTNIFTLASTWLHGHGFGRCVIPTIIGGIDGGASIRPIIITVAVIGGLGIKWIIDYTKNKKYVFY